MPLRVRTFDKAVNPTPRYGRQMREHNSALAGKESGYTTLAKKEEIFSDMS